MSALERLCEKKRVKADVAYGTKTEPIGENMHPWTVTLRYRGRQLTVPFFTGSAWTKEPGPADVISSLILDASAGDQDFASFCADFGYDEDSRKAEKTWKACAAMAPKIKRLLGDDFEEFQNAEH